MVDEGTVLTPQEVADILKIAKNTVYELIKRGELNAYRVGKKVRVDLKDVEEYKNRTRNPKLSNEGLKQKTFEGISYNLNPLQYDAVPVNGFVICGQDSLLDMLSRYLEMHPKGVRALRSYIGSYNGLYELYQGNIQVATAHLWDGDSGVYNIPYVRHMLPGTRAVIVHLACRMQGFYVAKGNPKSIKGWDDLKRRDISIINRERGSGTRVLLDEHLRKLGIHGYEIEGYDRKCYSHLAVASAVARGGADIALGNEKTGQQVKGIDFIPMQNERYEMVIKREDLTKPPFEAIMEILGSKEFRLELEGIGGYDLTDIGKIVAET